MRLSVWQLAFPSILGNLSYTIVGMVQTKFVGALGPQSLAAIGAGLFTAFGASQIRPVYSDANELRTKTGLPLLGVVSVVMGDVDRRRERNDRLRFVGASASLVLCFAVGLVAMTFMAARVG